MELADLLVNSSQPAPQGLLERTRANWPLNHKASQLTVPDSSDRVRLRQVIADLDEWGIKVSGVEGSQFVAGAPVVFHGSFFQSGDLKGQSLRVSISEQQLETVQVALQAHGFAAVVSYSGNLLVTSGVADDQLVRWMELDQPAQVKNVTVERFACWLEACPQLSNALAVRSLEEAGLSPEQTSPWLELQSDPDDDGRTHSLLADDVNHIPGWVGSGMSPQQAREWLVSDHYYFRSFSSVDEWIKAGWSCSEAMAWINLMRWSSRVDEVDELQSEGYTVKHALRLQQAEVSRWEFDRIRAAGLSPAETVAWLECGINDLDKLEQFAALSVDGRTLRRWNQAARRGGRDKPLTVSELKSWLNAGRSFEQAEPWLSLHHCFVNLALVEQWEQDGLSADDAAGWAEAGVPELSLVREWQAVSSRCEDPGLVGELVSLSVAPAQAQAVLARLGF